MGSGVGQHFPVVAGNLYLRGVLGYDERPMNRAQRRAAAKKDRRRRSHGSEPTATVSYIAPNGEVVHTETVRGEKVSGDDPAFAQRLADARRAAAAGLWIPGMRV